MSLEDLVASRKSARTAAEVAEILNVSRRLVYQLVSIGEIPYFKVRSTVRFEPKTLSDWLYGKLKASKRRQRDTEISRMTVYIEGNERDMVASGTDQRMFL